jgi:NTP pyrophosphatase (non-canonical NTP hydrolase)
MNPYVLADIEASKPKTTIRELQARAGANAIAKGFPVPVTIDEINTKLMLIVSEVTEAMDDLRNGRLPNEIYFEIPPMKKVQKLKDDSVLPLDDLVLPKKPCGFGVELADTVIRILDLASGLGIDLEGLILQKMEYNATRPQMHGKVF